METVRVQFKVIISESRYSSYKDDGEAELEFDIPAEMANNTALDYSEILKGLYLVALQRYLDKQNEEEE